MFAAPVDPRVIEAYERHIDSFRKAAALFAQPIEVLKIPYGNTTLPGYFIKPASSKAPRKTLLCTGGYDSTCEEVFFITDGRRGGGKDLYHALQCAKQYVLFTVREGAGEHCETGGREIFFQKMFGWLEPLVLQ